MPSFTKAGPWTQVQSEVHQYPALRQRIIRKLEKSFNAKVVSFFSSFHDAGGMVRDDDAELLESLLAVEHEKGPLVLIINSPGGLALAAERVVNVCRSYSDNNFEVVVPHAAKSAATMIAFGSRKIHMSMTAELGPVDPQVAYSDDQGRPRWISAQEYVRAYDKLIAEAANGKAKRIEPYLQQLQRFDAREIEALKSAQVLSSDISVRLLKSGMLSALTVKQIEKKIEMFLSQEKTSSHGRMITYPVAKDCGLAVELIDLHSPLWNNIWELYVRSDWYVTQKCKKLLESGSASLRQ